LPAHAPALREDVGVGGVKEMSSFAMGLTGVPGRLAVAAQKILSVRHGFKMYGIDAKGFSA
jgi:hypothetical protein